MLKKSGLLILVVSSIAGMDLDKKYTKSYVVADLNPIVESQISEMKLGLNFIWAGGNPARSIIRTQGKKRGATELELDAFEQFKVINYWYAQADYKAYVERLTETDINKLLKEIDGLNATNVDDVVKFQNEKYKIETKEVAFTRLIQSAHFNKSTNRHF